MTLELKEEDFQTKVLDCSTKPVVVEVWASRCHHCKTLEPIYKASAEDLKSKADFYQLKADDNMALVKSLKIMSVPTLLYYSHGVLITKKTGVRSQKAISKILDPLYTYSKEDAEANIYRGLLKRIFGTRAN
jgi:thioredoxin-like negative regulator of GroEL